ASSGLTEAEIEQMRKAAREHAAEDKQRKEQIDKLNTADSLIFSSEKNLKDYGDKIPADKKATIDAALARLKEVHGNKNIDEIDSAMEQLNAAWSAASEDLYRAQQAEATGETPDASAAEAATNGTVQDADFEVVDEGDANNEAA